MAEVRINGQAFYSRDTFLPLEQQNATLRALALDLVNQLTLLTRDDQSYLWRIGGRPLDDAYLALKRAVGEET